MFHPNNPDRFEDAYDEKGLLRDGKAVRVPVYLRDQATVQRRQFIDARQVWDAKRERLVVTDADATLTSGNRPGWRIADTAINHQARLDAYRDAENYLNTAYKNPSTWRKP